ncbi:hypothetical protein like AT5G40690 [Hibiscus trionum]|uniref:Uncharacterized protein n=1 Tax=Hibiscus trionum TaxID=183268 RepID=A0A9W7GWY3_HIBTR|nr:hypothetical protein like AT5G40690 [Hibiscus trionum]
MKIISFYTFICIIQEKAKAISHSKFTGKCGKSKDKTKGAQKFRTSNIAGFKFSGFSATGVLEYLDSFNEDEIDDHDDVNDNGGTRVLVEDDDFMAKFWSLHDKQNDSDNNEDEDDHMSFCDVGFMLDIEEDEGWCLLGEL